ncbi:cysteine dioxygenase family protein [Actinoallomurus iriomotensis]|uniref:cysteine dioxygenase family protein n=1 Tax=Actinoallomurus iriomotensis TaxID=478107 RepID=UPI0025538790|nr:cysteine dioxygenase family protein [Actinoallomurus iriomotensis]
MTVLKQALPVTPQLDGLVTGIRSEVDRGGDWRRTAERVAGALRRDLPRPEALAGDLANGQDGPRSRLLHVEPDGTFSIQAIVWPAGRVTPVHDHVSWCVFGVIQGALDEELFTLADGGDVLVPAGRVTNTTGAVTGFAPPGDLHRVANPGDRTAISIHVYGTDLSRLGSSALRYYDLPVRP